jgi:hypothetical protein
MPTSAVLFYFGKFSHLIWLKQCDPGLASAAQKVGIPSVWDVTDPMWWFSPEHFWPVMEAVNGTITSSKGLAEDYAMWCGRKATCLPDTLSLDHYGDPRPRHEGKAKKMIWFGHHANRMTLFGPMTNLLRLQAQGDEFSLTIMDDAGPDMQIFNPSFPVTRIKFDLGTEAEILRDHDLAILPPYPGPWGKCKSDNKELTAGAVGLAAVSGLLWNHMHDYFHEPDRRNKWAQAQRKMVEERYTSAHGAERLGEYLASLS